MNIFCVLLFFVCTLAAHQESPKIQEFPESSGKKIPQPLSVNIIEPVGSVIPQESPEQFPTNHRMSISSANNSVSSNDSTASSPSRSRPSSATAAATNALSFSPVQKPEGYSPIFERCAALSRQKQEAEEALAREKKEKEELQKKLQELQAKLEKIQLIRTRKHSRTSSLSMSSTSSPSEEPITPFPFLRSTSEKSSPTRSPERHSNHSSARNSPVLSTTPPAPLAPVQEENPEEIWVV